MMTMTLRIVLILVSLGTFAMIIRKIRESKMQIESAIFWIMLSIVLVLYSIFSEARGCFGAFSGHLFDCQLFVPVCDICPDHKGVFHVHPHFPAREQGEGAGAGDGA